MTKMTAAEKEAVDEAVHAFTDWIIEIGRAVKGGPRTDAHEAADDLAAAVMMIAKLSE